MGENFLGMTLTGQSMCMGAVHRHPSFLLFDSATSQPTLTLSACFTVPVCCVNSSVTTCTSDPQKHPPAMKDYGAPQSVYAASSSVRCIRLRCHGQSLNDRNSRGHSEGSVRAAPCHHTPQHAKQCRPSQPVAPPPRPLPPMCDSTKRKPGERWK